MATPSWYIREGDTRPPLRAQIKIGSVPLDLTDATVVWKMRKVPGSVTIEGDVTILDAEKGQIEYVPEAGVTDEAGTYRGVFVVTFTDNTVATVPTNGYIAVHINTTEV